MWERNDRPYKRIGTNPKNDKEKTCVTKTSMIINEMNNFLSIYTLVYGAINFM